MSYGLLYNFGDLYFGANVSRMVRLIIVFNSLRPSNLSDIVPIAKPSFIGDLACQKRALVYFLHHFLTRLEHVYKAKFGLASAPK